MSRSMRRRVAACLIISVPVGLVGLTAVAQPSGKRQAPEVNRAKEMATLIEQGQLNLRAATELAEKHVKGTALEVKCEFQSGPTGEFDHGDKANPRPEKEPSAGKGLPPGGARLIYQVTCFAKDKLQLVSVDALGKTIIEDR